MSQSPTPAPRRRGSGSTTASRSRNRSCSPATARRGGYRLLHSGKLYAYDGSVFDKLIDSSLYTGTHRHRFDEEGKGRGMSGRDVGALRPGSWVLPTTVAGGDIDIKGDKWRAGLRGEFYQHKEPWEQRVRAPSVSGSGSRSTTPRAPRTAQVARYEAWREGRDGQMVRDEELTREWQHGRERLRFEESTIQHNREVRAQESVARSQQRASASQPPGGATEEEVSVWYVDDHGHRRRDERLTHLWQLHEDKKCLADIEKKLGIQPPPAALVSQDPDTEVQLRWDNIQNVMNHMG